MDDKILHLAGKYRPLAVDILKEAIRIPADYVDRPPEDGGDRDCGTTNHEGPRLAYLERKILEIGAVDRSTDIGYDRFGNLWWIIEDSEDGVPAEEKCVVFLDGHTDTVGALRSRWREAVGRGMDPYLGMTDPSRVDRRFLREELGFVPPDDEWEHLVWGRGAADQLGGVVCQIIAAKILGELRSEGALEGIILHSYCSVAEEDNEGGAPRYIMREELPGAAPDRIPDVVILTEGTGCSDEGALGIYRSQRGRVMIEVEVTGKSCHGSMPWEGRNPLEVGASIINEAAERYARGEGFVSDAFLGPGSRTASFATLETPCDCAVPERFTFRLDRRLTVGEDPERAVRDVERMPSVARARDGGLAVAVRVPFYDRPTWKGYETGNPQIYPTWMTPEEHPAIAAAVDTYRRVVSPFASTGRLRREPRISRWLFSTNGVGFPVPVQDESIFVPAAKQWVHSGGAKYPAILGMGPGIEQNVHKIGEYVDTRELAPAIAFLARFPTIYRRKGR